MDFDGWAECPVSERIVLICSVIMATTGYLSLSVGDHLPLFCEWFTPAILQ